MLTPFPPFQNRILPAKIGAGMDRGQRRRTGNTVWHSMLGTLNGTDAYFRLAHVAAATDWGIGGSLDGAYDGVIYRWMDFTKELIPWASGPWRAPGYGDGAAYVAQYAVYGINALAESIEFSGLLHTPMTVKGWQSGMWLTAAIEHAGGIGAEQSAWNMHHREFCQPSYKDCCFERIYKFTVEYQRGIVLIKQHYEGLGEVPDFVEINKLRVPLPLGQKPLPPKPTEPRFIPFDPARVAVLWNASGRQWGNTTASILKTYKEGDRVTIVGYYNGEKVAGGDKWYVENSSKHLRIHESGIKEWVGERKLARVAPNAHTVIGEYDS